MNLYIDINSFSSIYIQSIYKLFSGDYENVNGEGEGLRGEGVSVRPGAKQAPSSGKTRYERSMSPPSSSSGKRCFVVNSLG